MDFLQHDGWVKNPALYTLLTAGWTEAELGERMGWTKNPNSYVSRDIALPLSVPYKRVLKYMNVLAQYLKEVDARDDRRQQDPQATTTPEDRERGSR